MPKIDSIDAYRGFSGEILKAVALRGETVPKVVVGMASCGIANGARQVWSAIQRRIEEDGIEADLALTGCIGMCFNEVLVDIVKPSCPRISYKHVTPEVAAELIDDWLVGDDPRPDLAEAVIGEVSFAGIPAWTDLPYFRPQRRIVLHNCGFIDPESIDEYIARSGYAALVKVLADMTPEDLIEEVKRSGLRGRGGAGFPPGLKWEFARKARGEPKYLIANADEGDPGAFMDRSLGEGDPHSVLEGMAIAGFAIGAEKGFIYCRAEYPLAIQRFRLAIAQARQYGLLGDHILGTDFDFDIELKEGAGAFVCGEETALMASIEGERGEPRPRPPFPATSGLWGKPTNINNVKSYASVPQIILEGADWFASMGTRRSKGTMVYALTGEVRRTGLIEVPMGSTLRDVIFGLGGGMRDGKRFKAVQIGGPLGGCLPEELLDTSIDYESITETGAIMGSGGMIVVDEDTCMVDFAKFFLTFVAAESCGKCVPCRVGSLRMLEILTKLTEGQGTLEDLNALEGLCQVMRDGSLCALGQLAPNPVLTTLRYFRDEFMAHIVDRHCPALSCKALISYHILPDQCSGCGRCLRACPVSAIAGESREIHTIDQDRCIRCGTCLDVCPPRFSAVTKRSVGTSPLTVKLTDMAGETGPEPLRLAPSES